MFSYIKTHWNGEQSLARSFWINFVLQNLLVNILFKAYPDLPGFLTLMLLAGYIWGLVGAFKASARYSWTNIWRILATLFLVVSLIINAGQFYLGFWLAIYETNTPASF
tara:strand:+ start:204 stop:530 length:327 start_codon:yes stop_codon:yes gene_type:complete